MSRQMSTSVIAVGPGGWVDLRTELEREETHKSLGFHKHWWDGVRFFHRDGLVYEVEHVEPDRALGVVSKILAYTFYNPWLKFTYRYSSGVPYRLAELRDAVASAIKQDDDVLTQFAEADELFKQLSGASTFDEFAAVVRRGAGS